MMKISGRSNRPRPWLTLWPIPGSQLINSPRSSLSQSAIAQDPWLSGSRTTSQGEPWRTVPIPDGGGIIEYAVNEADHRVILTRIFPF